MNGNIQVEPNRVKLDKQGATTFLTKVTTVDAIVRPLFPKHKSTHSQLNNKQCCFVATGKVLKKFWNRDFESLNIKGIIAGLQTSSAAMSAISGLNLSKIASIVDALPKYDFRRKSRQLPSPQSVIGGATPLCTLGSIRLSLLESCNACARCVCAHEAVLLLPLGCRNF